MCNFGVDIALRNTPKILCKPKDNTCPIAVVTEVELYFSIFHVSMLEFLKEKNMNL